MTITYERLLATWRSILHKWIHHRPTNGLLEKDLLDKIDRFLSNDPILCALHSSLEKQWKPKRLEDGFTGQEDQEGEGGGALDDACSSVSFVTGNTSKSSVPVTDGTSKDSVGSAGMATTTRGRTGFNKHKGSREKNDGKYDGSNGECKISKEFPKDSSKCSLNSDPRSEVSAQMTVHASSEDSLEEFSAAKKSGQIANASVQDSVSSYQGQCADEAGREDIDESRLRRIDETKLKYASEAKVKYADGGDLSTKAGLVKAGLISDEIYQPELRMENPIVCEASARTELDQCEPCNRNEPCDNSPGSNHDKFDSWKSRSKCGYDEGEEQAEDKPDRHDHYGQELLDTQDLPIASETSSDESSDARSDKSYSGEGSSPSRGRADSDRSPSKRSGHSKDSEEDGSDLSDSDKSDRTKTSKGSKTLDYVEEGDEEDENDIDATEMGNQQGPCTANASKGQESKKKRRKGTKTKEKLKEKSNSAKKINMKRDCGYLKSTSASLMKGVDEAVMKEVKGAIRKRKSKKSRKEKEKSRKKGARRRRGLSSEETTKLVDNLARVIMLYRHIRYMQILVRYLLQNMSPKIIVEEPTIGEAATVEAVTVDTTNLKVADEKCDGEESKLGPLPEIVQPKPPERNLCGVGETSTTPGMPDGMLGETEGATTTIGKDPPKSPDKSVECRPATTSKSSGNTSSCVKVKWKPFLIPPGTGQITRRRFVPQCELCGIAIDLEPLDFSLDTFRKWGPKLMGPDHPHSPSSEKKRKLSKKNSITDGFCNGEDSCVADGTVRGGDSKNGTDARSWNHGESPPQKSPSIDDVNHIIRLVDECIDNESMDKTTCKENETHRSWKDSEMHSEINTDFLTKNDTSCKKSTDDHDRMTKKCPDECLKEDAVIHIADRLFKECREERNKKQQIDEEYTEVDQDYEEDPRNQGFIFELKDEIVSTEIVPTAVVNEGSNKVNSPKKKSLQIAEVIALPGTNSTIDESSRKPTKPQDASAQSMVDRLSKEYMENIKHHIAKNRGKSRISGGTSANSSASCANSATSNDCSPSNKSVRYSGKEWSNGIEIGINKEASSPSVRDRLSGEGSSSMRDRLIQDRINNDRIAALEDRSCKEYNEASKREFTTELSLKSGLTAGLGEARLVAGGKDSAFANSKKHESRALRDEARLASKLKVALHLPLEYSEKLSSKQLTRSPTSKECSPESKYRVIGSHPGSGNSNSSSISPERQTEERLHAHYTDGRVPNPNSSDRLIQVSGYAEQSSSASSVSLLEQNQSLWSPLDGRPKTPATHSPLKSPLDTRGSRSDAFRAFLAPSKGEGVSNALGCDLKMPPRENFDDLCSFSDGGDNPAYDRERRNSKLHSEAPNGAFSIGNGISSAQVSSGASAFQEGETSNSTTTPNKESMLPKTTPENDSVSTSRYSSTSAEVSLPRVVLDGPSSMNPSRGNPPVMISSRSGATPSVVKSVMTPSLVTTPDMAAGAMKRSGVDPSVELASMFHRNGDSRSVRQSIWENANRRAQRMAGSSKSQSANWYTQASNALDNIYSMSGDVSTDRFQNKDAIGAFQNEDTMLEHTKGYAVSRTTSGRFHGDPAPYNSTFGSAVTSTDANVESAVSNTNNTTVGAVSSTNNAGQNLSTVQNTVSVTQPSQIHQPFCCPGSKPFFDTIFQDKYGFILRFLLSYYDRIDDQLELEVHSQVRCLMRRQLKHFYVDTGSEDVRIWSLSAEKKHHACRSSGCVELLKQWHREQIAEKKRREALARGAGKKLINGAWVDDPDAELFVEDGEEDITGLFATDEHSKQKHASNVVALRGERWHITPFLLGFGTFGCVVEVLSMKSSVVKAAKYINTTKRTQAGGVKIVLNRTKRMQAVRQLKQEFKILKRLQDCRHIVQLHRIKPLSCVPKSKDSDDSDEDGDARKKAKRPIEDKPDGAGLVVLPSLLRYRRSYMFLMEKCSISSDKMVLEISKDDEFFCTMCRGLKKALKFMEFKRIAHLDIKPSNVLIREGYKYVQHEKKVMSSKTEISLTMTQSSVNMTNTGSKDGGGKGVFEREQQRQHNVELSKAASTKGSSKDGSSRGSSRDSSKDGENKAHVQRDIQVQLAEGDFSTVSEERVTKVAAKVNPNAQHFSLVKEVRQRGKEAFRRSNESPLQGKDSASSLSRNSPQQNKSPSGKSLNSSISPSLSPGRKVDIMSRAKTAVSFPGLVTKVVGKTENKRNSLSQKGGAFRNLVNTVSLPALSKSPSPNGKKKALTPSVSPNSKKSENNSLVRSSASHVGSPTQNSTRRRKSAIVATPKMMREPVVCDFGLARRINFKKKRVKSTMEETLEDGMFGGTIYSAWEALQAVNAKDSDTNSVTTKNLDSEEDGSDDDGEAEEEEEDRRDPDGLPKEEYDSDGSEGWPEVRERRKIRIKRCGTEGFMHPQLRKKASTSLSFPGVDRFSMYVTIAEYCIGNRPDSYESTYYDITYYRSVLPSSVVKGRSSGGGLGGSGAPGCPAANAAVATDISGLGDKASFVGVAAAVPSRSSALGVEREKTFNPVSVGGAHISTRSKKYLRRLRWIQEIQEYMEYMAEKGYL